MRSLTLHYGSEQPVVPASDDSIFYKHGSNERASWGMTVAEHASEASSAEQANEWAVWANMRTDDQVTQYFLVVPDYTGHEMSFLILLNY